MSQYHRTLQHHRRAVKGAATKQQQVEEATVEWVRRGFEHHARLYAERFNNLRIPESWVRRSHADATEFLERWRLLEPLARLICWPPYEEGEKP